jgi:pyruvate-ferredoxin/flavodoxin oxidoreductase
MSAHQAKLVVESRAYPLFSYDPDAGKRPEECFDLDGNPAPDQDWPTYTLTYVEGGREKTMELPMTFADFAVTEIRFRKHFRLAPPDTWNENMVPLAEFLLLPKEEKEGRFPFVWSIDRKQQLTRLLVAEQIVTSCEERQEFWTMLRAIARVGEKQISREEIAAEVRREVTARVAAGLMKLAEGGDATVLTQSQATPIVGEAPGIAEGFDGVAESTEQYMAPWIDSQQCTACDECINLNPAIFQYNENKKAIIKNPDGGPYKDLVKAAERCTAKVIHPGLPKDRSSKDAAKWIARGEKYN